MPRKKLPSNIFLPHIALVITAIIWGIAGPVIKLTLRDVPVFTFLLYRFLLVGIIMLPYLALELRKDPINKRDIPGLVILGIAGQVSIALVFWGLRYTTALDAAIISLIGPVLTFVAGRYFYKEKITKLEVLGIGLATLGTVFIIIGPALTMEITKAAGERLLGNVLVLLYQLTWPLYTILGKHMVGKDSKQINAAFKYMHLAKLSKDYHPNTITAFSFYVGLAFFIPAAALEAMGSNYYPHFTPTAISGILYMAILSSIAAYGLFQWGLKYLETQETAVYGYLGAIFALPAAYLLLGETPTTNMLIGGAIIVTGVVIAEKFKS